MTFYETKHVDDAVYQLNDTVSTLFQEVLFDGQIICGRESIERNGLIHCNVCWPKSGPYNVLN